MLGRYPTIDYPDRCLRIMLGGLEENFCDRPALSLPHATQLSFDISTFEASYDRLHSENPGHLSNEAYCRWDIALAFLVYITQVAAVQFEALL